MQTYVTVLDLNSGTIDIYPTDETVNSETINEFLHDRGHKESECSWMRTDKLDLKIHTAS